MKLAPFRTCAVVVVVVALGGFASPAAAQATRTWVASEGSDLNPCSPLEPCKTFAAAISKTATGGEINCLNPGGYGPVTITRSMTIDCTGTLGAILAGDGNGVVVNAGVNDIVRLRGLSIQGGNAGINGVRAIGGGTLLIEDCAIENFKASSAFGISLAPSLTSTVLVSNTTVSGNGSGATGGGVLVQPLGSAQATVVLNRVTLMRNANNSLFLNTTGNTGGITATVRDSVIASSATGVSLLAAAGPIGLLIDDVAIVHHSSNGILVSGANGVARVTHSTITGNVTGVNAINGGQLLSFGNNQLIGNGANGVFVGAALGQN
ncbi:MAG: right-handed parallel beta-helix repeat-containing protein [Deltaproteobacteria bacterium]|nr:right-handed parallel beta-helix repeat-containing protein [Deltaproteobacteria bacterium]